MKSKTCLPLDILALPVLRKNIKLQDESWLACPMFRPEMGREELTLGDLDAIVPLCPNKNTVQSVVGGRVTVIVGHGPEKCGKTFTVRTAAT